jgi:hypothetical protein
MGAAFTRKYATAATLDGICLRTAGTATIRANPTLASGDVKISKDGGAFANLATLPSAVPSAGKNIEVALSSGEMTCARAVIHFVDAAGAEWDDFEIVVETFGNASAQFPPDYSDTVRLGQTALPNAAAGANTGLPVVGTQVPNATAGATGGLLIAGSNAATTFATLTVSGATTLTGNVSMGGTLGVTGTVTFNAFTVTNAFTVSGASTFTGAVTASNVSNNIVGVDVAKWKGGAVPTPLTTGTPRVTIEVSSDINVATFHVTDDMTIDGEMTVSGGISGTLSRVTLVDTTTNLTNGVSVAPLVATANPTFYASTNLPDIAQASAPAISWTILDSSDAAVSLSGKTVRLVTTRKNDSSETPVFTHATGGSGITISGTGNNVVTVQLTTTDTANPAALHYWLWNITDDIALASGLMSIVSAKKALT